MGPACVLHLLRVQWHGATRRRRSHTHTHTQLTWRDAPFTHTGAAPLHRGAVTRGEGARPALLLASDALAAAAAVGQAATRQCCSHTHSRLGARHPHRRCPSCNPNPPPNCPPSPPPTHTQPHTHAQVFVAYYVVTLSDGQEAADDLIARLANDHAAVADGDALRLYTSAFVADSIQALVFGLLAL